MPGQHLFMVWSVAPAAWTIARKAKAITHSWAEAAYSHFAVPGSPRGQSGNDHAVLAYWVGELATPGSQGMRIK